MVNPLTAIIRVTGLERGFGVPFTFMFLAGVLGNYFDKQEASRQSLFRDKSYLYGGRVKEGDPPSWPHKDCLFH